MSEMCGTRLADNTGCKNYAKNRHMHHRTNLWGYVFATKAYIDNQENCSAISPPHVLTTWWTLAH